eukprot:scaffold41098_cov168-Skeletonema_marinoi.AAC.1
MHQCVSLSIRAVAVSSETYDPEFRNVPGIYTLELRGSAKVGNLGTLILGFDGGESSISDPRVFVGVRERRN